MFNPLLIFTNFLSQRHRKLIIANLALLKVPAAEEKEKKSFSKVSHYQTQNNPNTAGV